MEPIIFHNHLYTAVAFCTAHGKQAHRFIIHPHQLENPRRFFPRKEAAVRRFTLHKTRIQHVEKKAGGIAVQIGVKAEEAGQADQKHQMEIREVARAGIQPTDGIDKIGEKRRIASLFRQSAIKELGKKHGDAHLVRVAGKAVERIPHPRLSDGVQPGLRTDVRLELYQREGTEQRRPSRRFARTARGGYQERGMSALFRIDMRDIRLVAVFHHIQHDAMKLL